MLLSIIGHFPTSNCISRLLSVQVSTSDWIRVPSKPFSPFIITLKLRVLFERPFGREGGRQSARTEFGTRGIEFAIGSKFYFFFTFFLRRGYLNLF